MSVSITELSFSERAGGSGPPPSAAAASGGTVAGKLMWIPSRPAGGWGGLGAGIGAAQSPPRARDRRAPVPALRDVARVTKALHQYAPGSRDPVRVPADAGWSAGEAVAGQGGDHDVERVLGPSTMSGRIGERRDDLELFDHRPRPSVRDDNRQGIRMARARMDEVDVNAVDLGDELRQRVELGFGLAPFIAAAPITDEVLQLRELSTLRWVADRLLVRPTCRCDPSAQIGEVRFRNVHRERADCCGFVGTFRCGDRTKGKKTRGTGGCRDCEKVAPCRQREFRGHAHPLGSYGR